MSIAAPELKSIDMAMKELEAVGGKIFYSWNKQDTPQLGDLVILDKVDLEAMMQLARQSCAQVAIISDERDLSSKWLGLLDWHWSHETLRTWQQANSLRWSALQAKDKIVKETSKTQGVPALLLDRDGVVNVDHGYVGRVSDVQLAEGTVPFLRFYQDQKWPRWLITNQSGIGRGYYSEKDFDDVMAQIHQLLAEFGVSLSGEEHSMYHPTASDPRYLMRRQFRKPRPGMIHHAKVKAGIDLQKSIFVGDHATDIIAAWLAGVGRCYLLQNKQDNQGEWLKFNHWKTELLQHWRTEMPQPQVFVVSDLSKITVT